MARLYRYSPAHPQPATLLPDLDSDRPMDLLTAWSGLPEHTFLIDAEQLAAIRRQLQPSQPEGTLWGLDPTDALLRHLGVHHGNDGNALWLRERPPYVLTHAQACTLFGPADRPAA